MSDKIKVTLSPTTLEVNAGESVELTATIHNRSQVVDQFTIALEGLAPAWYDFSVASVSLFPGDKDQVRITIHPPKTAETKAGSYPFTVSAVSGADPQQSTAAEASVEVRTFAGLAVDMSPTRIVGQSGTYMITLTNQGNADVTQSFEASDPEEGLNYTFKPQEVTVPAGGSATVELVAKLRKKPKIEGEKEYPFQVVVKPSGADKFSTEAKTLNGQLVYERKARPKPKMPRWLIGVLAGVAVAIIVILLLRGCGGPPEIIEFAFNYTATEQGYELHWVIKNAAEGDINGVALEDVQIEEGEMMADPAINITYVLTATNRAGAVNATVIVPPFISFGAEWLGCEFGLAWTVKGADQVYLDGESVLTEGDRTVYPDGAVGYNLTARNEGGAAEKTLTVAPPAVTVASPDGGEELVIGSQHSITWNAAAPEIDGSPVEPATHNVGLEYSSDGGNTWDTIDGDEENDGYYRWMVPDGPSDSCLVRITIYCLDGSVLAQDTSDEFFSIVAEATVTLTRPDGGENWWGKEKEDIKWTTTGLGIDHVGLDYSTDGGESWDSIDEDEANDDQYSWMVPPGINSERCRVRVTIYDSAGGMLDSDMSDDFTIAEVVVEATVQVRTPMGGEQWWGGGSYSITWATRGQGIEYVTLHYSTDGGNTWNPRYKGPNDGQYSWTVPLGINSKECYVRVTIYGSEGELDSDVSEAFTIAQPTVEVMYPGEGDRWWGGERYDIIWEFDGPVIEYVNLQYSTDKGNTWHGIHKELNMGMYGWDVPCGINSEQCLVKITICDAEWDMLGSDISELFTIAKAEATVELVMPKKGAELYSLSEYKVMWKSEGGCRDHVRLFYTTDGEKSWEPIEKGRELPDSGFYFWTVPYVERSNDDCALRIDIYDSANNMLDSDTNWLVIHPPMA